MRRKHLICSIVFLLICSFITLVAVSQQKSFDQVETEMETAYKNLYNPEFGAWPVYKEAFDELDESIKEFIEDHGELKSMQVTPKLDPVSQLIEGV